MRANNDPVSLLFGQVLRSLERSALGLFSESAEDADGASSSIGVGSRLLLNVASERI